MARPTKNGRQARQRKNSEDNIPPSGHDSWHKALDWISLAGFWRGLFGLVVLIFAWHAARHFFP